MSGSKLAVIFATTAALTACGGGGGGGSSSGGGTNNGVSYTGVTSQAALDSSNAEPIVTAALAVGNTTGTSTGVVGVDVEGGGNANVSTFMRRLAQVLAADADSAAVRGVVQTATVQCDTGTASIAIDVNQNTGDFSGTVNFAQCQYDNITLNGPADVVGNFGAVYTMSTTLRSTTITPSGRSSLTAKGVVDCDFDTLAVDSGDCLQNVLIRDDATGLVYQLQNLRVQTVDALVWLDGIFYHPTYGYVQLATPPASPLSFELSASNPNSGLVIFRGANASTVVMSALNAMSYELQIDADGDDSFEWVETKAW